MIRKEQKTALVRHGSSQQKQEVNDFTFSVAVAQSILLGGK